MFRRQKLSESQVYEALRRVQYPDQTRDLVSAGSVTHVSLQGNSVQVVVELLPQYANALPTLRQATEAALRALPGVATVQVDMRTKEQPAGTARPPQAAPGQVAAIPGIQHIVAVASGKGGVGKSTVATNLAVALAMAGLRTGLLDADIYGPSIPLMMGIHEKPQVTSANRILPFVNHGVKLQSLGFFLGDNAPVIWRGPMVMRAVQQLLQETEWGELDVLIVDLPPGTGDVQLTLVQTVPLTGAVLVTTPQDLALLDVKKAAEMFKQVNAPLLGIVENMSFFTCPDCGKATEIFRHGGGQKESERLGIPLLGRIPLEPIICDAGDTGVPVAIGQPESPAGEGFHQIAAAVLDVLHSIPQQVGVKIIN
jgi:ATP-binding protein involved in chromosome partitioning